MQYVIAGQLRRDFIITPDGKAHNDILGGNVLYAAGGLAVWDTGIGLLAKVGEDFPQQWLDQLASMQFVCEGITILPEMIDLRSFIAYPDHHTRKLDNPVSHYSRLDLPFPKALLGYTPPRRQFDNRNRATALTFRLRDVPEEYLDASAVHICPMDFMSHTLLPAILRQGQASTITLEPAEDYMNSSCWDDFPSIVKGLTAFIVSEKDIRALFVGRSHDLWQMAETITGFECEIVVIRRDNTEYNVWDSPSRQRWTLPAYPARSVDPTGSGDAFCGGFLAGLRTTYDPLQAAIYGSVSASLAVEGCGPFFALDALPGLAQARREALSAMVRKV